MNVWHNQSITEAASLLDTDVEQGFLPMKQKIGSPGMGKINDARASTSTLVIFASQFK